jgi:hypothetical protein
MPSVSVNRMPEDGDALGRTGQTGDHHEGWLEHLFQIDVIHWRRYCGALFRRRCDMTSERSLPQQLLQQVTDVYEEQPDLRLTPAQGQRLWRVDGPTCGTVLRILVDGGILQRTPDGRFVRRLSAL